MLIGIGHYFPTSPLLPLRIVGLEIKVYAAGSEGIGDHFNILSRLRCNNVLYAQPMRRSLTASVAASTANACR